MKKGMFKRNYTIIGITPEMAKLWEKDLRDDLKFFKDEKTGMIYANVSLTILEAIRLKLGIIKCNLTQPCVLKLKMNGKGKRCRV